MSKKSHKYKVINKELSFSGKQDVLRINTKIMEELQLQRKAPVKILYNENEIIIRKIKSEEAVKASPEFLRGEK